MEDVIGFVVFMGLLIGAGWVLVNYWHVILLLVLLVLAIAFVVFIVRTVEASPKPRREIRNTARNAEKDIKQASRDYRKQVSKILK